MIDRLGECSPGLEKMLAALGARFEGDKLVIPTHGIREEMLAALLGTEGDKIVIPTHGIRNTEDGLEVNVRHHYCRFHESEWKMLRRVNARTVP